MNKFADILGLIGIIALAIRTLIYYYLEVSNGRSNYPFLKINADYFVKYKKAVKKSEHKIVSFMNFLLPLSWISMGLAVVLVLIFK